MPDMCEKVDADLPQSALTLVRMRPFTPLQLPARAAASGFSDCSASHGKISLKAFPRLLTKPI
jgi:hypothetical protein